MSFLDFGKKLLENGGISVFTTLSIFLIYSGFLALRVIIKVRFPKGKKYTINENMGEGLIRILKISILKWRHLILGIFIIALSSTLIDIMSNLEGFVKNIGMFLFVFKTLAFFPLLMVLWLTPIIMILNIVAIVKILSLIEYGEMDIEDIYEKQYKLLIVPISGSSSSGGSKGSSKNSGGGGRSGGGGAGGSW